MTNYKILYWQEVPTQIKAEDESEDVDLMLDGRFMAQVDILAAKRGLQSSDDYLAQWKWSEELEREGSAREVAEAVLEKSPELATDHAAASAVATLIQGRCKRILEKFVG